METIKKILVKSVAVAGIASTLVLGIAGLASANCGFRGCGVRLGHWGFRGCGINRCFGGGCGGYGLFGGCGGCGGCGGYNYY